MNNIPDITTTNIGGNPTIASSSAVYCLPFYQTKDSLMDVEVYRNFLNSKLF